MTLVAPRIVNDVSYVTRIKRASHSVWHGGVFGEAQVSHFVADTVLGEAQVSLFVAGAVLDEAQVSHFVAYWISTGVVLE